MKILTGIITIFLILGLFGVPSSVFAQSSSTGSDSNLQYSASTFLGNNFIPLLKGSSKSSSSKKLKFDGDDDSDASGDSSGDDSGSGWIITIIILIIVVAIIVIAVWYFFLRK